MQAKRIQSLYYPTLIFALLLAMIGLLNLYSATSSFEETEASPYFMAQLSYTLMGIFVMLIVSRISLKTLYALSGLVYIFSLLLLVAVLVVGAEMHGSLSWLDLGFVRLQPSEFGKIGLIFILSRYLANLQLDRSLNLKDLFWPIVLFGLPALLVVMQNDLGSSMFYGFIFATMIFIQGIRFRLIVVAVILVSVLALFSYHFVLQPYQKGRIVSFLNPELDSRGSGYHLVQSKIAVGSGGFLGKGYLKGQSHRLKFLPERHTDFIFPVLLEEWGFVGGITSLAIYFLFLMSGINITSATENRFGFFLSIGLVAFFFWHLVINLGGVLGLLPLTGVPLPFFSYGGSSLIANWMSIGCLLSVVKSKAA